MNRTPAPGPLPPYPAPAFAAPSARPALDAPRSPSVRWPAVAVMVVATYGVLGVAYLLVSDLATVSRTHPSNVYFALYARQEPVFLFALVIAALLVLMGVSRPTGAPSALLERVERAAVRLPAWPLAGVVLVAAIAGTLAVMHGIGLSMDEAAADFQARIFSGGHLAAAIPAPWRALAPWMTPIFITYKPAEHLWVSSYLPVYAAMRAPFVPFGATWLVNPLLAAATVLLLDRVARRIWPESDRRRTLALVFLLTSAQFLVTSMSAYSMPAHLCLNLLWLILYLRDDRVGYICAPMVGVLAMGLHNPFPHALFVAPFLLRMLLRRRYAWLAWMGACYLAGAALWLSWLRFAGNGGGGGSGSLLDSFRLPSAAMLLVQGLNLALVASWQTPILAVLLVVALLNWRRLAAVERDLATGLVATFAFYFLFPVNQGHGWGYRYIYGALGNVMLLAVAGTALAARSMSRESLRTLVAASAAASLVLLVPLRLRQVEGFVRPFAAGLRFISTRPGPIVAVVYPDGWYTTDLVRNDPLFRREPRVIAFDPSRGMPIDRVPAAMRDSIYVISRPQMEQLGLTTFPVLAPSR